MPLQNESITTSPNTRHRIPTQAQAQAQAHAHVLLWPCGVTSLYESSSGSGSWRELGVAMGALCAEPEPEPAPTPCSAGLEEEVCEWCSRELCSGSRSLSCG
jgi:hypothetical protein